MAPLSDKFTLLDLLHPVDREFCNSIFISYSRHLAFIDRLLSTTYKISDAYLTTYEWKRDHFHDLILKSISVSEQLVKVKQELTVALINIVEHHFSIRHQSISFTPYLQHKEITDIKPLESIIPLIENITRPSEPDLFACGKNRIAQRMKEVIALPGITAELKEFNIRLNRFYSISTNLTGDIIALSESDKNVNILLDALALFFLKTVHKPDKFTSHFGKWAEAIEFGRYHHLCDGASIKFFKNRSVKISFSTKRSAREFFEQFELGTIEQNNPAIAPDQVIQ